MSDSSLYTYNVVIGKFEEFANSHALLRRFTHGQISQADLEKEGEWPWMHVTPTSFSFDSGALTYSFDVYFADLPRDKEEKTEYQRQSMSECIQLAGDFVNMLENGDIFDESVVLGKPISAQPFIEEFSHVLTGVQLSIDITVDYEWNACIIPFDNPTINVYTQVIDFESTPMNSIIYKCDGNGVDACYGTNQTNINDFVAMLNANPPVQENACFLNAGTYYNNGDGRVRCEMPIEVANTFCAGGEITLEAIYD
jgi:hypothetical protein